MSKYKDMAKAKASDLKGGMSNIKGGVKGKVNGVLGRKASTDSASADHVARPISTLRDPDSFAPPPRRTSSGLSEPPPRDTAPRRVVMAPSKYQDPRGPRVEPPHSRQLLEAPPEAEEEGGDVDDEDERQPARAPPYRMDTTGLSTGHLPPPPMRRDAGASEKSPPSYDSPMSAARRVPPQSQSTAPGLPPRLPPRSNSTSSDAAVNPLPSPGNLNRGAVSRLGAAGIAVPALGIGSSRAGDDDDDEPAPPRPPRPMASQPNLLQSRMFKAAATSASPFSSSAENVAATAPPPSEGTTWAQKQAALKTASAFHKDPSSISFADARAAAGTANNFRQRHGHQVAAGLSAAGDINQKYGVAERIGALSSQHSAAGGSHGHSPSSSTASITAGGAAVSALAGKKKPPPPPPPAKKKPSLAGPQNNAPAADVPPPVPFATRPTF